MLWLFEFKIRNNGYNSIIQDTNDSLLLKKTKQRFILSYIYNYYRSLVRDSIFRKKTEQISND